MGLLGRRSRRRWRRPARSSEVPVVLDSYVETRSRRTTSSRRRTSLFLALVGTRIASCRTPVDIDDRKKPLPLPLPPPTTTLVRRPRRLRPQTTLYTAESKIPLPRPMGAPTRLHAGAEVLITGFDYK